MSDVFDNKTSTEGESPVAALVGEGKKFATIEDLARGKQEADTYITQLEEEGKTQREKLAELESGKSKEDTVAQLLKEVREQADNKQGNEGNDNQVTDEDLSKKIKAIMQGETDAQTRAKNRGIANQTVLDKVQGDVEAASAYLAERAKQLGMGLSGLRELGETSPEAFAKLIDVDQSTVSKGITTLPDQGGNTSGTGPAMEIDGHRTKAYYDNLKKEMGPSKYWGNTKVQGQYTKDAMALKERFN